MPRHPLGDKPMTDAERQRRRRERLRRERGPAHEAELSRGDALSLNEARQEIAALQRELAARRAPPEPPTATIQFTKAQQAHIEAAIKRRVRELEKDFAARKAALEQTFAIEIDKRAQAQCDARFPKLQERSNKLYRMEEQWREMMNNHKPIFTGAEFGAIRFCLHTDMHPKAEPDVKAKLNHAFVTFNLKKLQLTGKK